MAQQYPDSKNAPVALLGLARSYSGLNNYETAEQTYQKIRENYSGSEITDEALLEMSDLKIKEQNYEEAMD